MQEHMVIRHSGGQVSWWIERVKITRVPYPTTAKAKFPDGAITDRKI